MSVLNIHAVNQRDDSLRLLRIAGWILLVLILFTGIGLRLHQDLRVRKANLIFQQRVTATQADFDKMTQALLTLGRNSTLQDVNRILKPASPLVPDASGFVEYTDPNNGGCWSFHVDITAALTGYHRNEGVLRPFVSAPPWQHKVNLLSHKFFPSWGGISSPLPLLIWLIPSAFYFIRRRFRPWAIYFCSLWITVCLTVSVMSETLIPFRAIQDPMFWITIMAVATSALMFWQWCATTQERDPRLCLNCEYDLSYNTSGSCPECGADIAKNQKRLLCGTDDVPHRDLM